MTLPESSNLGERILILTPSGNDASNVSMVLENFGFSVRVCQNEEHLSAMLDAGVGAVLVAEEAFGKSESSAFAAALAQQPPWSDIPVVFITYGRKNQQSRKTNIFGEANNITLLERPFAPATLLSSLQVALRARRRQYQLRDLLEEQHKVHEELKLSHESLEGKVAERTRELQETVSELEAFSYSVSHDLRAPLRAMQGYSQCLLEDYGTALDSSGQEFLQRILNSSLKLDRLIQDILTYSRVARANLPLVSVDTEKLVREIIESYPAFQMPQSDIQVQSPLLPMLGHEGSMIQCLSNLFGNAAKFVLPGVRPVIRVWTQKNGSRVRIHVQDQGLGIHPDHHQRIFRIFEKADAAASQEGTGIGLAIVKKAVERMGGQVGIISAPGKGSTFWIELASS